MGRILSKRLNSYEAGFTDGLEYALIMMESVESLTDLYIKLNKKRKRMLDE